MISELSYDEALQKADALRALGQTTVHLWRADEAKPWHLATHCEAGCVVRMGTPTDASFTGSDERSGLTFKWSFDLECRNANGSPELQINTKGCHDVLRKLKGDALVGFRSYLSDCASPVKAQGDEYQAAADRQFKNAAILRDLVNS